MGTLRNIDKNRLRAEIAQSLGVSPEGLSTVNLEPQVLDAIMKAVKPHSGADTPPDNGYRFMRRPEVLHLTGLSRSGLYARIADCTFPAPIRLSQYRVAWISTQVYEWMEERIQESRGEDAA